MGTGGPIWRNEGETPYAISPYELFKTNEGKDRNSNRLNDSTKDYKGQEKKFCKGT